MYGAKITRGSSSHHLVLQWFAPIKASITSPITTPFGFAI
jgi:hypothetical protein